MARNIVLVRHGVTRLNLEKRFVGATDAPLAPEGEIQAENLAGAMSAIAPDRIVSSSMRRTTATAQIACRGMGMQIEVDASLREVDFGLWEGLTFAEIEARFGEDARRWAKWEEDFVFPGGDCVSDFFARVRHVLQMIEDDAAGTIALFTHSGVIRHLLCLMLRIPADRFFSFRIAPGSVTIVEMSGGHASIAAMYRPGDYKGGA